MLLYSVKQVFSTLEVLGWYTNGTLPVEDDAKFHEQVMWLTTCTCDLYFN